MIFEFRSFQDFNLGLTLYAYNFLYANLIRLAVFFTNRLCNCLYKYKKGLFTNRAPKSFEITNRAPIGPPKVSVFKLM